MSGRSGNLTRRTALRGGALAAAAAGLAAQPYSARAELSNARGGNTSFHASKCPAVATAAGYNRLVFSDDFTSSDTIDLQATGRAGYNWYCDLPFGWEGTSADWVSVDHSVLTLDQGTFNFNWAISSVSPKTGSGTSFKFGYFEALGRFDPALGGLHPGFPAFWSLSTKHMLTNAPDRYAELDFMEAYSSGTEYYGAYVTTIHDWSTIPDDSYHYQNSNNWNVLSLDYGRWHKYGCLWQPGEVSWYVDDTFITKITYGPDILPTPPASVPTDRVGLFDILDQESMGMTMVLGTGVEWPFQLDWVKVWS